MEKEQKFLNAKEFLGLLGKIHEDLQAKRASLQSDVDAGNFGATFKGILTSFEQQFSDAGGKAPTLHVLPEMLDDGKVRPALCILEAGEFREEVLALDASNDKPIYSAIEAFGREVFTNVSVGALSKDQALTVGRELVSFLTSGDVENACDEGEDYLRSLLLARQRQVVNAVASGEAIPEKVTAVATAEVANASPTIAELENQLVELPYIVCMEQLVDDQEVASVKEEINSRMRALVATARVRQFCRLLGVVHKMLQDKTDGLKGAIDAGDFEKVFNTIYQAFRFQHHL